MTPRTPLALLAGLLLLAGAVVAQTPGLPSRANIGAYLDGTMPASGEPPQFLSQTNAFSNLATLTPHAGLIPYDLNTPFWSNHALKTRWMGLPYNSANGTNNPKITNPATGNWGFPEGTVWVKHFEMVIDERPPVTKRRMETRIMVRTGAGDEVYGRSYRWQGSDAIRVDSVPQNQRTETLTITDVNGNTRQQDYIFPTPIQCLECHNTSTQGSLGVKTRQVNRDYTYAATGNTDNQLRTYSALGMLATPIDEPTLATLTKLVALSDATAPLQERVRSYLDSNCAQCHNPGWQGIYDGRYDTPVLQQNIMGFNPDSAKLHRNSISTSRIHIRDSALPGQNPGPMPPIARNTIDTQWIATIAAYVNYAFDIATVASTATNQIRVTFNSPLDAASAATAGNYALNNGATVSGAMLEAGGQSVLLNTSTLTNGTTYRLTVNRVRENAAPKNFVWPNSRKDFVAAPPVQAPRRGDFDDDGRSDVLWREPGAGLVYQWRVDGANVVGQGYMPSVPAGWVPVAIGDMNGDRRGDVFWRETGSGLNYQWQLNGLSITGQGYLPSVPAAWAVMGLGDFNADGRADVLWRNAANGENYIWLLDGLALVGQAFAPSVPGPDWDVAVVADITGDGRADVLWRNKVTGDNYLWPMNGFTVAGPGFLPPVANADWEIVAAPDANGDGRADVVWRNKVTGDNYLWLMSGFAPSAEGFLPSVSSTDWKVVGYGDYDGDGRGDILWRNTVSGENYLWTLNGLSVVTQAFLPSVGASGWFPVK